VAGFFGGLTPGVQNGKSAPGVRSCERASRGGRIAQDRTRKALLDPVRPKAGYVGDPGFRADCFLAWLKAMP